MKSMATRLRTERKLKKAKALSAKLIGKDLGEGFTPPTTFSRAD
ncbi:MAG: hypothetical protein ACRENG_05075 [bacterium]